MARWATLPLMAWGLAACSAAEELTTQSVQPAQKTAIAEPDCGSLKAEIDKLNTAKLPEKLQNASATGTKKYNPTPDEWAAFPRYNNLVETYTVKKCEPALQQAKAPAKPKAKTAAAPAKTADAGAAIKAAAIKAAAASDAPAKPAAVGANVAAKSAKVPAKAATATAAAEQPQQPAYQGVMLQIPPSAPEQKQ